MLSRTEPDTLHTFAESHSKSETDLRPSRSQTGMLQIRVKRMKNLEMKAISAK